MEDNNLVLVTGGTGFLASHIILQLLQKGFPVRTTIRKESAKAGIIETMRTAGLQDLSKLSFVLAELTRDDNWDIAMSGCRYVISVASPVFFDIPKNEEAAIKPALEGIQRIINHARRAEVQRIVMTSNFGAVGFSQTDKTRLTTEEDWTNTDTKGLSTYEKSKTLAEKRAWDLIGQQQDIEFCSINPVAILGPSLNAHVSGSYMLIQNLTSGNMKAIPKIPLNIVDVRDVADLHIRAMTTIGAKGLRFMAAADGKITWPEIGELIRKKRPAAASRISQKTLPDWVITLAGLFNHKAAEGALLLRLNRNLSNERARQILSWKPRYSIEETILASVDNLSKYELLA